MRGFVITTLSVVVIGLLASMFPPRAPAADAPADRVVVMYFHRTERCPTCLKMGGYSEEAVQSGFAKQLESGAVGFYYIDFQDKKNARLAKAYGVSGPALIVAKVVDNKVAKFSNLKDIWTKVREKKVFLQYVQDAVTGYLKPAP
ncbi:MAG: nitrophenyl compound nitroreductase subunit ArsF family protein [Planctomycetota bacterium]